MRFLNWAQAFEEQPTCDDILKRVRKTETAYWIFMAVSVLIAIWGIDIILTAPKGELKQLIMGLFMGIVGVVNIAVIKLWAHIRLTMYFIIWDRQNRLEAELRKSEAQDL